MERKDVVDVLRRFREVVLPRGAILDLQVIKPNPVVEVDGRVVCEIDGEPLIGPAVLAARDIDAMIDAGLLVEEAVDDHDVLKYYASGAAVVEEFESSVRIIPEDAKPMLRAIRQECVVRERCRLRRLGVVVPAPAR
jgi:hypothetical protein